MKKTPYQRIVRAAKRGTGVRLSADECRDLYMDDAIARRAEMDDENVETGTDDLTDAEHDLLMREPDRAGVRWLKDGENPRAALALRRRKLINLDVNGYTLTMAGHRARLGLTR